MITHDKEKKIELKNGQSYDKTTVTLPERAKNLFVNMADFILYISIDKEVVGGNVKENRYIYFRSDGDIEAGSRFEDIPEKIDYDVDLFLETFEKAVLSSYDNDGKAVQTAKEEQAKEAEERIEQYVSGEVESAGKTEEDYIEEISSLISKMNDDQKAELKKQFKEANGSVNYKNYGDIEKLSAALEIAKGILE